MRDELHRAPRHRHHHHEDIVELVITRRERHHRETRDEILVAARYGASVERGTASPEEAYGGSGGSWSKPEYTTLGPVL
jgi:hypothetical protein